MSSFQQFAKSFGSIFTAISFARKHKMWCVLLIPIAICLLLAIGSNYAAATIGDFGAHWAEQLLANINCWGIQTLRTIIYWTLFITTRIAIFIAMMYVGSYIVLLIMSPILSYISSLAFEKRTGLSVSFSLCQLVSDVWRGIRITVRNIFVQLLITLLIFCLSFIPIVAFFTPILYILAASYFYGFSLADYVFERRRMDINDSIRFAQSRKATMIGLGLPFALAMAIPWIGLFVAIFISPITVIASELTLEE